MRKIIIILSSLIYFVVSFYNLNLLNGTIALDLLFIYSLFSLKNKPFHFVFILFFGLFYVIPTSGKVFIFNNIFPLGIDVSLTLQEQYNFLTVLYVFLFSFMLILHFKFKLKLFAKFSLSSEIFNPIVNITFNKKIYRFLLLLSYSVLIYSSVALILSIQRYGYQEFHLGEGVEKRNIIYVINQFIALGLLYYGIKIQDKLAIVLFIIYNIVTFFTGMRMPSIVNLLGLVILLKPKLLTKTSIIIPSIILTPAALIVAQLFRNKISFNFNELFNVNFILGSLTEVNDILGYTNELLMASIKVVDNHINIGFTSIFSDVINLFDLVWQKITNAPTLTMLERANSGNFSYQVFRYFQPQEFFEGITAGGSSIAEIYYYLHYFGVIFYAGICVYFSNIFSKITTRYSFPIIVFYFNAVPLFFRNFRDGAFSFIVDSIVNTIIIVVIVFFIKIFVICFKPIKIDEEETLIN